MANPLAIALALYGGYKGYKAGKERGGGIKSIVGAALGAAGGFYGGQALGSAAGLQNVAGTQNFTNAMMAPFKGGSAVTSANAITQPGNPDIAMKTGQLLSPKAAITQDAAYKLTGDEVKKNLLQRGIEGFRGMTTGQQAMTLGTLAGGAALASGAFKPEPYKRSLFTYNIAYPDLYRNRKFFVQDPTSGAVVEQEQLDYIPEENPRFRGSESFGPYGMETKTMNTGGLVEVAKFNEGGMPTKMTHDENDSQNYKRANGYVADLTSGANKDEDTILAQLADGEFVTRTDGILGAGILMGADPNDPKGMRKKGAEFFYDQQKKMKRLYDLFNSNKKTN